MAGFFVLDRLWLDARASQCGRTRSIYYRTPPGSGDIDFNVLGLGAFVLGEMHREQPILELRFYFVAIGIIRQGEAPRKGAVAAFDAVMFGFLSFLLELAFAGSRRTPVF